MPLDAPVTTAVPIVSDILVTPHLSARRHTLATSCDADQSSDSGFCAAAINNGSQPLENTDGSGCALDCLFASASIIGFHSPKFNQEDRADVDDALRRICINRDWVASP